MNKASAQGADVNASFTISVSEDGMQAVVTELTPAAGDGVPLTAGSVAEIARAADISADLDPKGVEALLKAQKKGALPEDGIVIARGTPPVPPEDGTLETKGNLEYPVFPGDTFGRINPPRQGRPGETVTGRRVNPEGRKVREMGFEEDGSLEYSPEKRLLTSTVYGLIRPEGAKVKIQKLLSVSPDKMSVYATLFHADFLGEPLTMGKIRRALRAVGIRAEPIAENVRAAAIAAKREKKPQEKVVVAAGTPPVDGMDGYFQSAHQGPSHGTVGEDDRMDFFERGDVHTVNEGDLLGRIVPPAKGKPGLDVYGQIMMARDGKEAVVTTKDGVEVSADGMEFRATEPGVVVFSMNQLSITDVMKLDKDVDIGVGNVRMDKGSLVVTKSILTGITVTCPGNVYVKESIDGATVNAGGDVMCRGGILMGAKGKVLAKGHISAKFAMHANLETRSDLYIANELNDCTALVDGKIICTRGSGIIVGGTIRCAGGIEANDIGSELGVPTHVIIGKETMIDEGLMAEMRTVRDQMARIDNALGHGEPEDILRRTPKAKLQAVAELLKAKATLAERLDELKVKQEEAQAEARTSTRSTVKARRAIYPGVTVTIAGRNLHVKKKLEFVKVYYEKSTDSVQYTKFS